MAAIQPVVDSQPSIDSPSAGEPGVHTGRIDDETDQKKLTGKELGKGKNKNFVPLTKSSTKKKAGEKPGEEEEEGEMMENKKDGCGCKSKSKKLDKKKCDSLTPARIDACWAGYKKVGMKNKGGKQVPDCVPIKQKKADSVWASGFKFDGKALSTEAANLAATDVSRAKKKKNAQGQPKNKIMAGTRNT